MATKKTPSQIRWEKRKDKVNKARRAARKAARRRWIERNKQIGAAVKTVRTKLNTRLKTIAREAHKRGERAVIGVDRAASGETTVTARMVDGKVMVESVERTPTPENPDTIRAKEWAALARKKGGIEKVAAEIAEMRSYSYGSGKASGESGVEARMRGMRSMLDDRIVSAFVARMQLMETQSSSGLPPALVVSGLEVVKIIDALVSAGYSANSRMRPTRGADSDMIGKAHSEVRHAS